MPTIEQTQDRTRPEAVWEIRIRLTKRDVVAASQGDLLQLEQWADECLPILARIAGAAQEPMECSASPGPIVPGPIALALAFGTGVVASFALEAVARLLFALGVG